MATNGELPDAGYTVFRVPRSHFHCRLQDFDWESVAPKALREQISLFYAAVVEGQAPHLVLTGAPGAGKTHLGLGMYRAVAAVLGTERCTWVNVPAFCEEVKRGYGKEGVDPWEDYEAARRLVVLDDLFGRELTTHEKDQIITRLLDTAYTSGAAVMLTMNPDVAELSQRLPPHEISRLLAKATIIPMKSNKDWRRG